MSKLRLLKIDNANLVVGNFGHLPMGLQWLSWKRFPSKCITIPHLEKLAVLDMSESKKLSHIEGISGLRKLKELYLKNCRMLQSLPELPPSLIRLNLSDCTSMERLPNLSNLKNLQDLCLESCYKLTEIRGLESLESLINLDVNGCHTFFKTLGMIVAQGKLPQGFVNGVIEKLYVIPDDDDIKGMILYFICEYEVLDQPEESIDTFSIEAEIQRNNGKKVRCCFDLRTEVVILEATEYKFYSCYFPGSTWLGLPLKNRDKIELSVSIGRARNSQWVPENEAREEGEGTSQWVPENEEGGGTSQQVLENEATDFGKVYYEYTVVGPRTSVYLETLDFVLEYEAMEDSQQLEKQVLHLISSRRGRVDGTKERSRECLHEGTCIVM